MTTPPALGTAMGSNPFELGKTYQTLEGKSVTVIAVSNMAGYECVQGNDGETPDLGWRYNRESDRGRCTGSAFDMSDPLNLIPDKLTSQEPRK